MGLDIVKDFPSIISSLSSASAAVIVVIIFLKYIRESNIEQGKLLSEFKDYHKDAQERYQEQIEKLTNRQEESQETFQKEISRLTEQQNNIIRESILALKEMKVTVKGLESVVNKVIQVEVRRIKRIESTSGSEVGEIVEIEEREITGST